MKVIVDNSAKDSIDNIFYYNLKYSLKNALETDSTIKFYINDLASLPYIGRYVPEIPDKHFREIIYKKTRQSSYRIIYYISDITNTIYVLNVLNSKQDFNKFLKLHNYFKSYFRF
jgi:plasmid stabilization system protein ParE